MTIKKRLARSNLAMLLIPLLTAGVLALAAAGVLLLLLRGNLLTLHDAAEQVEQVLHGFKLTLCVYAAAAALLTVLSVVLTNLYLTRQLFRHIAEPLDTLTAGVARIRDGNLDAPIDYAGEDEFKAVCDAVDELASRLKASLEQQLMEQQKKRELIAGMSHDLKSPLTSIRAYTEALLDGVAKDRAAEERYLKTIHARERDIETLAEHLFAVAKLDVSEYPVRLEPLPLRQTIETLADGWRSEHMAIRTEIPAEMQVRADRELFSRITANLLGNSRKYAGKDCVRVTVSAAVSGGRAEVCFADDGAGVPDAQLPRLFDAFYRGDAARTAPGEGSGLGLAVVKMAVEKMGGAVRAENGKDGGLRVIFTLPLAEEENHDENTDYRG